jgi:hypothetical protein
LKIGVDQIICGVNRLQEKTCFQNISKFDTEDYFVQRMNITTIKGLIK